jgi:hypothetical protein
MPTAYLDLPRLRPDQYEIARHPAKVKILAMGRRWGKSVLGSALALTTALAGGRVAWCVPTYRNGRPLWRAAMAAVAGLRKAKLVRVDQTERIIEFPSGGFLCIYSMDNPDSIRGEQFDLVILDEAASMASGVWTEAIMPTLADRDGSAFIIGTPKGRNWFFEEFVRGSPAGRRQHVLTRTRASRRRPTRPKRCSTPQPTSRSGKRSSSRGKGWSSGGCPRRL